MSAKELSPRERRYINRQQEILDAALALVAEGGVENLSMRAIADRIDYSPAGLYEYYGSKEEIINALCWAGHRTLKRYMAQVPLTLPGNDYLLEIGMAYIQFALQNPDYFLLIFTSQVTRPTDISEEECETPGGMMDDDSSFPLLLNGIARAVEKETIHFLPGLGLFETAYSFWAIVHGLAMLRITYLTTVNVDFATADRLALTAFIRGMSKEG